jgi:hypothetical protein
MSSAYWWAWTSLLGILLMCGKFSTVSVIFHFRKKAAVAETFCTASVHILPRKSARHFRAMSGKAHPLNSSGRWRVVMGTRKMAPFQINHVHGDVSCWIWRVGGGRTCAWYHILYPVSKTQVAGVSCSCLRAYRISYFCPTLLYCRIHRGSTCHPTYCDVLE